ncbi:MAG TPA: flagellar assembly protein FliW [Clostridiales bacterium]|nr:flagellar assembly protein FliW [Clostridiales bacterium]
MLVRTKHFGEVDLNEDKIINFDQGILGFEDNKKYAIIYDNESGERPDITWLQNLEEPALAIPVISPFIIKPDYNPTVEDAQLSSLGELTPENLVVLVSVTVPNDIKKISVNLKAPFVINADTKKGCQVIADNADYEVKHYIYEKLQAIKNEKGGK